MLGPVPCSSVGRHEERQPPSSLGAGIYLSSNWCTVECIVLEVIVSDNFQVNPTNILCLIKTKDIRNWWPGVTYILLAIIIKQICVRMYGGNENVTSYWWWGCSFKYTFKTLKTNKYVHGKTADEVSIVNQFCNPRHREWILVTKFVMVSSNVVFRFILTFITLSLFFSIVAHMLLIKSNIWTDDTKAGNRSNELSLFVIFADETLHGHWAFTAQVYN